MKKSELKIFADGLEKIQKNHAVAKKVTLKITSMIDASEKIIYSQEIKADELQVGNFNAFRKEVNILTTYHNGLNIAETDCKLEIGGKIFKFKGGKFASKLNLLVNQAVTRSGTAGMKRSIKLDAKKAIMDKFVPADANLLQFIDASEFLEKYTDEQISQGTSMLQFAEDGTITTKLIEA